MKVLGLDPANKTGFAIARDGKIIDCGVIDLPKRATQLRCSNVRAMETWLIEFIKSQTPDIVCVEDAAAAFKGVGALKSHARYAAIIDLVCERLGVKQLPPVHPSTLKAFATDSGRAKKPQMIAAANRFYGLSLGPSDDNQADACHVCAWAMAQLKKPAAFTA